ncbi:protein SINE1-like [Typha angustifolia]|uniref:protein SINE1-like n=1 Tax=Typha angustifolia TaxID=59011 RepID=UPI003C2B7D6D
MGRSLSPLLRQELANLDKDADSRKSAMKALKSYAKDLDSKAIPHFLAEVSDTKGSGSSPGECTISLYEILARVHGRNIVPQIDNIMSTIMSTLSLSGGSFPLHQACSKVVPAIARYGIDHSTPDDEKMRIICSLCRPLCNALMGPQESSASGAALCLKALVESNNWRFASDEMVNDVCLKVAGALHEKATQSNAHMGLVMALVKHNGLITEAYARSLVRSGLQILASGVAESNSQKRLSAIQMINFLMKFVDPRSISSELSKVVDVMEQCQNDRMPFVRGAAFEASQTAKSIAAQKGSRHEISSSPIMTNFHRRKEKSPCRSPQGSRNNLSSGTNGSPAQFCSPESQTVDSSITYDAFTDSPISVAQPSCNSEYNRRANRRLWNNDVGNVDVSLKDGLLLRACSGSRYLEDDFEQFSNGGLNETNKEHLESFSGFLPASSNSVVTRDTTPSPQRSRRQVGIDDIKIYTTPRKLIRSLQNQGEANLGDSESQLTGVVVGSSSCNVEWNETVASKGDSQSHHLNCKAEENDIEDSVSISNQDAELVPDGNESVSSTCEVPENSVCQASYEVDSEDYVSVTKSTKKIRYSKTVGSIVWSLTLIFLVIVLLSIRIDNDTPVFDLVPT